MDESLVELFKSLNVVLGALCALLGAFVQNRYNEKYKKRSLLSEKLERVYFLCQEIYDGHKRELDNALAYLPNEDKKFLESRNHPGRETSELKMLVRSYAPDIECLLEKFDDGHNPLKQELIELEKIALSGESIDANELKSRDSRSRQNLVILGNASNDIKRAVSKKLNKIAN